MSPHRREHHPDIILARSRWILVAAALLEIERETADGDVAAHAITTAYYIVAKAKERAVATMSISDVLRFLTVVPTEVRGIFSPSDRRLAS